MNTHDLLPLATGNIQPTDTPSDRVPGSGVRAGDHDGPQEIAGSAAIVRTIIQMASNLGLSTIAEGVENLATMNELRSLGCDEVQGFHIARPMPADAFAEFVANHRRRESLGRESLESGAYGR
ncbi:MAG: EAL domain-containing protein [Rhodospirillaceae bacterium]